MTSRQITIRPDNINSDGKISFKNGFPTISFTIQAQNGILDPKSIRINGNVQFYRDNLSTPTPVQSGDADKLTMDNTLGVYNLWDQLTIRHVKSHQIVESIKHYARFMKTYTQVGSSLCGDLVAHMSESALCMPNPEAFFESVMANNANGSRKNNFSAHLPCGFLQSGSPINLMESSFGAVQIVLDLTPDLQALFCKSGTATNLANAHYEFENLNLTCEIADVTQDQMASVSKQTSGVYEFNSITSLYTTINSTNAQLQFALGLKNLQSVFMNFIASANINNIAQNGMSTTYPCKSNGDLAHFTRVQFLRGGQKYPASFDFTTNIDEDPNVEVVDPELLKYFVDSVIPEYMTNRSAISNLNNNRGYKVTATGSDSYLLEAGGGSCFGLGMKYSQFNTGQDFSNQQWGCSLESTLTDDSPQSVFLYFKAKTTLVYNENGLQIMN